MSVTPSARYSLTLRVEIDHRPEMLRQVASAIGLAGRRAIQESPDEAVRCTIKRGPVAGVSEAMKAAAAEQARQSATAEADGEMGFAAAEPFRGPS